jgi:hypothetical protein
MCDEEEEVTHRDAMHGVRPSGGDGMRGGIPLSPGASPELYGAAAPGVYGFGDLGCKNESADCRLG